MFLDVEYQVVDLMIVIMDVDLDQAMVEDADLDQVLEADVSEAEASLGYGYYYYYAVALAEAQDGALAEVVDAQTDVVLEEEGMMIVAVIITDALGLYG